MFFPHSQTEPGKGQIASRYHPLFRGETSGKCPPSPSLVRIYCVLEIFPKRDITVVLKHRYSSTCGASSLCHRKKNPTSATEVGNDYLRPPHRYDSFLLPHLNIEFLLQFLLPHPNIEFLREFILPSYWIFFHHWCGDLFLLHLNSEFLLPFPLLHQYDGFLAPIMGVFHPLSCAIPGASYYYQEVLPSSSYFV